MEEYFFHNQGVYHCCLENIGWQWEDASASEPEEHLLFAGMVMFYLGNLFEGFLVQEIKNHLIDDNILSQNPLATERPRD